MAHTAPASEPNTPRTAPAVSACFQPPSPRKTIVFPPTDQAAATSPERVRKRSGKSKGAEYMSSPLSLTTSTLSDENCAKEFPTGVPSSESLFSLVRLALAAQTTAMMASSRQQNAVTVLLRLVSAFMGDTSQESISRPAPPSYQTLLRYSPCGGIVGPVRRRSRVSSSDGMSSGSSLPWEA